MSMATDYWHPLVAPALDAPEAQIREMDSDEAQNWCNFILLKPADLPPGLSLRRPTMRPEAPPGRPSGVDLAGRSTWTISNRSAHKLDIEGEGRSLRVKQFLYDWAPPAFDHPSLWLSPVVQPFLRRNAVGWLGTDYRRLPAASVHLQRTMVEVSVTAGAFEADELIQLVRSLEPACPSAVDRIEQTPLAVLSYNRRHVSDMIAVPVGYWKHKREPAALLLEPLTSDEVQAAMPRAEIVPPPRLDYLLDTVFVVSDGQRLRESEYVYDLRDQPGQYLRVLSWDADASGSLEYPPTLDRQPCAHERLTLNGHDVYYARGTERYGPHEAVWTENQTIVMLLAKPADWTDAAWFHRLLAEMV